MAQVERRLAAIMFADIVGYSTTSQKNEDLAQTLLEEYRAILRNLFARHSGTEVKTMGDAFLVEFSSATGAVSCATEIQRQLRSRNQALPEDKKILARIGIHLGDIVHRDADVYGDAVNIASRIEAVAEPGGVCVSQQVYDHIRNKADLRSTRLGARQLKNIGSPVDLYQIMPAEEHDSNMGVPEPNRIAILPLANIGHDPENEYFADGLTEELISAVSRVKGLAVTSRTSVMRYKNLAKAMPEVGRELGVQTVLEGSVRRRESKVRVAVQLIDVQNDRHLWSQTYDREIQDIFAIQSDIAQSVASALELQLLAEEREDVQRKSTRDIEAYKMYLKGRYYWNERNPESIKKAIRYFEEAIARDPSFTQALVGLADCHLITVDQASSDPKVMIPKIRSYLDRALETNERSAEAHASLGVMLTAEWKWSAAEAAFKRAIQLNPNYATAHQWYSLLLRATERPREALDEIRIAQRLDPFSPIISQNVAIDLLEAGQFDEGVDQLKKTLTIAPNFGPAYLFLGGAYVSRSRFKEAIAELEKGRSIVGDIPPVLAFLGYTCGLMGDNEAAARWLRRLEELSKTVFVSKALLSLVYFAIGDKERAFSLLSAAYEERSNFLTTLKTFVAFREFQADSRFAAILEKVGR